jgi:hypothetical protein
MLQGLTNAEFHKRGLAVQFAAVFLPALLLSRVLTMDLDLVHGPHHPDGRNFSVLPSHACENIKAPPKHPFSQLRFEQMRKGPPTVSLIAKSFNPLECPVVVKPEEDASNAAGVVSNPWEMADMVKVLEDWEGDVK